MPQNLPAKKSLGQHYLHNPELCRKIALLLQQKETDQIIEIGPGPGGLTRSLLALPHKRLLLLEKDNHWAEEWQKNKDVEIIHADALRFDWASLNPNDNWKLIGNLPYNIASPLVWDVVGQCRNWKRAVFMTQKEVAERFCAAPNSRKYGALSVWVQCHARVKLEFSVSPGAFLPPPKVDSAVTSFEPLSNAPRHTKELKMLLDVCFQQRRKQLGSIFKRSIYPFMLDWLAQLGIPATCRPENLTCSEFLSLAERLNKTNSDAADKQDFA